MPRSRPPQAAGRSAAAQPVAATRLAGRAPRAPCRGSGRCPRPATAAGSTTTSGVSPTLWIQRLSGVSQRATVSLNAPPSPVSSCHCWTVPLPYDCWPTSVARFGVLQRPGDDLARRRAAAVDEHDEPGARDRSRRRRRVRRSRPGCRSASCSQKTHAGADELAGDLAGRRHVATGVAAQVEDEPSGRRRGGRLSAVTTVVGRRVREAGDATRSRRSRRPAPCCRPPSSGRRRG